MSVSVKRTHWPMAMLPMLLSSLPPSVWAQAAPAAAPPPAAASPASAEPSAAAASAPRPNSSQLDSVTVTAQRTSQNLQVVPVSVTAFTPADLENKQINSVLDVTKSVPNLNGSENTGLPSASAFFLRGIGQDESIATSDPAVGTYIDGVYVARQVGNNAYLYDIERIEVLRGPQGTLYGRNTSGGAISIITQKPSDTFEGNVRTTYGNYGRWDVRGSVSGPIADKLSGSFAAYTAQQSEGYQKNVTTGQRTWDQDAKGARGALRYRPNADIDINFSVDYGLDKPLPVLPINAVKPVAQKDYFTLQSGAFVDRERVESTGYTLNAEWALGGGITLKSITGYRDLKQRFKFDLSDNPTPLYVLGTEGEFKQFSQEFNVTGKSFENRLSWVGGVFYMNEKNNMVITDDLTNLGLFPFTKNLENKTQSTAAYGQATYHPTPELGVTLGGRWTREHREVAVQETTPVPALDFSTADVAALGTPTSPTYTAFTPKVAVDYAFTPALLGYVSYTEGFKSGGWNGRALNAAEFVVVKPEKVKSYETGVKSEWLDRTLRVNASYFYADYSDLIVSAVSPTTGGFVTVNAARAAIQGLELETVAKINSRLKLNASLGTMNGKYKELDPTVKFSIDNQVKRVPKLTYQLGADYEMPVFDNQQLALHANYSYTGSMYVGVNNTPYERTDPRRLLDVLVSLKDFSRNLTVFAGCRNCTDQRYFHSTLDFSTSLGFASQYPGAPRTFNVGLSYDFGG